MSTGDADEVRRFADFLTEVGPCKTEAEKGQVWRKHYPEDYALAVAERDARLAPGPWPCANYTQPVTCLTAPSTEAGRCDHCRSLAPGPVRAGDTSGEEGL